MLDRTPPFLAASDEKQSALAHFEPKVSLASRGMDRRKRRAFNEEVLASEQETHPCAQAFSGVVDEEIGALLLPPGGTLDWDTFSQAWFRVVRRIVLVTARAMTRNSLISWPSSERPPTGRFLPRAEKDC